MMMMKIPSDSKMRMNLLKFVRLHKGLVAYEYDWKLVFGPDFQKARHCTKVQATLPFVLDSLRKGEKCKVDTEYRTYYNPQYYEKPRKFASICDLNCYELSFKFFVQEIARALGLPVRGISMANMSEGLACLRRSHNPIYISIASSVTELEKQLLFFRDFTEPSLLLTLLDFSSQKLDMNLSYPPFIELLSDYVDENTEEQDKLEAVTEMSVESFFDNTQKHQKTGKAIIARPEGATYRDLTITLKTTSKSSKALPEDDELVFQYRKSEAVTKAVKDLPEFNTALSLSKNWQLFRWHLLAKTDFVETDEKLRHKYSQRRTALSRILNTLTDMPKGSEPFCKGVEKYAVAPVFLAKVELVSPSVKLTRYNRTSIDE